MKGPIAIMRSLRDFLAADAELTAYCMTKYQKTLKFFLGVDDEWKPLASEAPLLAMRPGSYSPSADRSKRDVGVIFGIVIEQEGVTAVVGSKELDGLADLEALYERVERAIMRFLDDSDTYNGQGTFGETATETAYPLFMASWDVTFQEDFN